MRSLLGLVVFAAAACAHDAFPQGAPLEAADDLVVVAHQDDDLLFMQVDLAQRVTDHRAVTIVYVTAGDAGNGVEYANARIEATKAAYGLIAGSQTWSCGWIDVSHHAVQHCRLASAGLSLVYLGYPDGGLTGATPTSLLHLWEGTAGTVETIAAQPATYDQDGLIETVAALVATTRPLTIRTLDLASTHGTDHSDHLMVGALAWLAVARAGSDAELLAYRGYNINYEPVNAPAPLSEIVSLPMRAYEACMTGCGACGQEACPVLADPRYDGFVRRRYVLGARRPPLEGVLRSGAGCLGVRDDGSTALVGCASATTLQFEPGRTIRVGERCLQLGLDGSLVAGDCSADPRRRFLLDDEGHLWAGVAAPPGPAMDYDHALCIVADDVGIRGATCGAALDWRWDLLGIPVATPRKDLDLGAHGRAIRLADLTGNGHADLCAVDNRGLRCALGDGTGHFRAARRIDAPRAPLTIVPGSLALGDVDHDGIPDACGRDTYGILCATTGSGYATVRWSQAFATTATTAATDGSLGVVDGAVCGRSSSGVECATRSVTELCSTWPTSDAPLWPADLDGDGAPDWCTATPDGPACGLAIDQPDAAVGVAWGFSLHGLVEGSAAADGAISNTTLSGLADVSGDGRADLCTVRGNRVECALSNGRGFGPRTLLLEVPRGTAILALWLGDLDGDGKADPCVDDGTAITCAPSP